MSDRIHATEVPKVEFEFNGETFTFVYNLVTMNKLSEMAREDKLPASTNVWDYEHVKCLLEVMGYTHHPDADWDSILSTASGGTLTALAIKLTNIIHEENEKAFGSESGEVDTEPTEARVRRRRRASTG